jgi:hypothetical protein
MWPPAGFQEGSSSQDSSAHIHAIQCPLGVAPVEGLLEKWAAPNPRENSLWVAHWIWLDVGAAGSLMLWTERRAREVDRIFSSSKAIAAG